ncbi:MAG: hypothetical protein NUW02_00400 [Candidatus Campbellbacteria bacterium]|nr:hypothetical protein [Candidatus Campbellbacteria bacterium]
MITTNFLLAGIAFLVSIVSGLYFLVLWFLSGRKHAFHLYLTFGFVFLLLFKMPNIIINANITVVQRDLYPFFFITLILHLLAYFLFIEVLAMLKPFSHHKAFTVVSAIVLILSGVYFSLSFLIPTFDTNYAPVWLSHVLFFIPMQIFLLFKLRDIKQQQLSSFSVVSKSGIFFVMSGVLTLLVTSLLYIFVQVGLPQQSFWYLSVISSPWISVLQIIAVPLLFFGFRAITLTYLRNNK